MDHPVTPKLLIDALWEGGSGIHRRRALNNPDPGSLAAPASLPTPHGWVAGSPRLGRRVQRHDRHTRWQGGRKLAEPRAPGRRLFSHPDAALAVACGCMLAACDAARVQKVVGSTMLTVAGSDVHPEEQAQTQGVLLEGVWCRPQPPVAEQERPLCADGGGGGSSRRAAGGGGLAAGGAGPGGPAEETDGQGLKGHLQAPVSRLPAVFAERRALTSAESVLQQAAHGPPATKAAAMHFISSAERLAV